jgi:hypothetical protein
MNGAFDARKEPYDMLVIGMLSLICAVSSGVFGFTADAPPAWTWGKGLFVLFLVPAVVAFMSSTLKRPSLLWEVVDDIHEKRTQKRRLHLNLSDNRSDL